MADHLAELDGEWALWRDVAIRSAGFAVEGLDVFGPGDEEARLREVANDPRFREAVTWQNPAVVQTAIDKVATASPAGGSKRRQRNEVVASYWQRYCAKNDTIGFFGPLAWGRLVDDGPAIVARWPAERAARQVHIEPWCLEMLAESAGVAVDVPLGPHPEHDVRLQIAALPAGPARDRARGALDRIERRVADVAAAPAHELAGALDALDAEFVALTTQCPTRRSGQMYAGRTLVYLDCMRDLEIDVGPAIRDELRGTLPALLAASRWYCGAVYGALRAMVEEQARQVGDGPLLPILGQALAMLFEQPPVVAEINAELRRRWSGLLGHPDPSTIVARARVAFADYAPAWPWSVYHSPDIQIAARSAAAIDAGDFLCVAGDFHPGTNTMGQGLFANRHPDRERFLSAIEADAGRRPYLIPPPAAPRMGARIRPAITRPDWVHVAATPDASMPQGYRVLRAESLRVEGDALLGPSGELLGVWLDLLEAPMFVAGIRGYDPFPVHEHGHRLTVSRTVLRRETWPVAAERAPRQPDDLRRWAREGGLPRRTYLSSPLEDKPIYVDFESEVLTGIAARMLRRAAAAGDDLIVKFTEMLPMPEDCWLQDAAGNAYTSELRMVAVDLARRAPAASMPSRPGPDHP